MWHGMVDPVALSLRLFRLHLPYPSTGPLSAEDDDGKLNSYVKRECDLKRHISYQRDVEPN